MKTKILLSVTLSLVLLTACSDSSSSVVDKTQADVTGSSSFEDTSATDESSEATTTQATTTTAPSTTTATTPPTTTTSEAEPSAAAQREYLDYGYPIYERQVFIQDYENTRLDSGNDYVYAQIALNLINRAGYCYYPLDNYEIVIAPGPYQTITLDDGSTSDCWSEVTDIRYPDIKALKEDFYSIYSKNLDWDKETGKYFIEAGGKLYMRGYEASVSFNGWHSIRHCDIDDIKHISETEFTAIVRCWYSEPIWDGIDYIGSNHLAEDPWSPLRYTDNPYFDNELNKRAREKLGRTSAIGYAYKMEEATFVFEDGAWKFKSYPIAIEYK